jgi:UDPglucose--hexose-1-phosphate uridylyltransferase
MEQFDFKEHSHSRLNILTGEWILVSPHRSKRPWQGKIELVPLLNRPAHDPDCFLCSGNKRADGTLNPDYKGSLSFTNDFSALLKSTPEGKYYKGNLLRAKSEAGVCRVIVFSNRHDLTLPELDVEEIKLVIDLWCKEFEELSQNISVKSIQIFENKGDIMGCSNPHPHGQIWAQTSLPQEIIKETVQQKRYSDTYGSGLLSDYLELEIKLNERIVVHNEHFVALVPFWAVWPYETIIISKRKVRWMTQFTDDEKTSLADILKNLTVRYDNLFRISFPYSAGIHQAPVNDGDHFEWHWHMHFYPPLLRSATVKKFMVGYEMLANPQRDITPEWAAEQLRGMSEIHYTIQ